MAPPVAHTPRTISTTDVLTRGVHPGREPTGFDPHGKPFPAASLEQASGKRITYLADSAQRLRGTVQASLSVMTGDARHQLQSATQMSAACVAEKGLTTMDAQQLRTVDAPSVMQQGGAAQHGTIHECADLLRDQIRMLEGTLVPGGTWDKRIAEAEQTIDRLRLERSNALRALASLRDALEEVMHGERTPSDPCAEAKMSSTLKEDRLSLARSSSRPA